jgi:L-lactate dehydrogenase complex protein LldE
MTRGTVALFVTCLVDLMRPTVGFAAVRLLEHAGYRVAVPLAQACCGQTAYNSGDTADARAVAKGVLDAFEGFENVVAPSGSCAGMIREHYPRLFAGTPEQGRAEDLAARTHELLSFLVDVAGAEVPEAAYPGTVTYHDSCSGLRELGIKAQPRALLGRVRDLELVESAEAESCCGFGGLFCVKYPDTSERMVDAKVDAVLESGAGTLLGGDLGCLMNLAGRLARRGAQVRVRHAAEVLAGLADRVPPLADGGD